MALPIRHPKRRATPATATEREARWTTGIEASSARGAKQDTDVSTASARSWSIPVRSFRKKATPPS
jgi:hypothetical protein